MIKKICLLSILVCSFSLINAQGLNIRSTRELNTYYIDGIKHIFPASKPQVKYWIYFSDKDNSSYTKSEPGKFLTQKAIDRRTKFNISINETDFPVSEQYVKELNNLGISIEVKSRWLNAVSAYLSEEQIATISQLTFISQISKVNKYSNVDINTIPLNNTAFYKSAATTDISGIYGRSKNQIDQINLDTILQLGFTGGDMVMAVIDAGFFGMDTATLFQSMWDKGQILGFHNFPDDNDQVFNIYSGYHGSWVSSVIAGDIDSVFSGSAPDVKLYLFRTEIADSEYVVEEDHWLEAAELADYIGVDLINSSLGYTTFDDSLTNHTYADLDGNTSVVTMAADMAASKGILVCNSAGNEGASTWHYVSMPADGDSVFSIGAVDTLGIHAGFSGYGPTSDGRLKPNVVALGVLSAVMDPGGNIYNLGGTSFASPLIAGACASLWGAFPYRTNMEIMDAVQQSAHLHLTPNDSMGYGIPNFGLAFEILKAMEPEDTVIIEDTTLVTIEVVPNPASSFFSVFIESHLNENAQIQIINLQGEMMYSKNIFLEKDFNDSFTIPITEQYASGIYILSILTKSAKQSLRIFVN
jgi:hypothetical protein